MTAHANPWHGSRGRESSAGPRARHAMAGTAMETHRRGRRCHVTTTNVARALCPLGPRRMAASIREAAIPQPLTGAAP